ncbi:MAG: nitrophenyl compound nitroreductase subunit ArsF family protein [Verrucomicrobiota bacterium]|nr:nitrophenyl compound nitroreductase subunit ArsF family protein [Verrucomicrobiota bacterium]
MKTALRLALMLVVITGLGFWAWGKFAPKSTGANPTTATSPVPAAINGTDTQVMQTPASVNVVVTYFTTNVRCVSCRKIEELTLGVLDERYSDALKSGRIVFQTHNIDLPENKHFITDYDLSFKTVVVEEMREGKQISWQKLDDVWTLLDDPVAFYNYVSEAINKKLSSQS